MNHRQRIEAVLSGAPTDRIPVALWRHFPVDDQSAATLAEAVLEFQQAYDFDLVKVTPASSYCVRDWGVQDVWRGSTEGTREYTHYVIHHPEDWGKLKPLDPYRGSLGEHLSCLQWIISELEPHTPVIPTIFSPLAQAKNLAGRELLITHLRQFPEAVHGGLKVIAESTQRFIQAAGELGISGIFYAVQHAQFSLLSRDEYLAFGRSYDLNVLEVAKDLWLNILHLHGNYVMFDLFVDYPVAVINWHDRETEPSLATGQKLFPGVVCGGIQREQTLVLGTPEQVIAEARDAISATDGRKLILGTGCVVPITTPRANLMAARRAVEL